MKSKDKVNLESIISDVIGTCISNGPFPTLVLYCIWSSEYSMGVNSIDVDIEVWVYYLKSMKVGMTFSYLLFSISVERVRSSLYSKSVYSELGNKHVPKGD